VNWVEALVKLEQLGAEHVVPGHGPLLPPTALTDLRAWMEELQRLVKAAIEGGQDREAAISSVTPQMQAFQQRGLEERLSGAISAVYNQFSQN